MSAKRTENGVISQHSGSQNHLNKGESSSSFHVKQEQIEDIKKEEGQVDAGPAIPTIQRSKGKNDKPGKEVKKEPIVSTESVMENEASSNSQPSSPTRNPTSVNKNIPVGPTTNEENDAQDNTRRRSSRNTVLHSFADRTSDASPAGCSQKADPKKKNIEGCSRKLRDRSSLAGKKGNAQSYLEPDSEFGDSDGEQSLDEGCNDLEYEHSVEPNPCDNGDNSASGSSNDTSLSPSTRASNTAVSAFKAVDKAKKAPANQIAAKEKPANFKCDVCEKRFLYNSLLKVHKRIHTGEKPFKCDVCESSFSTLGHLNRHRKIHTGEKSYACSICNKMFSDSYYCRVHERSHTGEKPYKCSFLRQERNLINALSARSGLHERVHTGVKPYACSICDKRFSQSHVLRTHQRIHNGTKPYSCMHCRTEFATKDAMVEHREKEHPTSSQVPNMNKSPAKSSSSNDSNNRPDLTEKESNSSNETNADVSTQDPAVLAGNSNNSLRDSTINKDMGLKVVKRRAISAENGATVHLEPDKKKPRLLDTQVESTLTETQDNTDDISPDKDTSESMQNAVSANLEKNSESPSDHPVLVSSHFCVICKIGFPEEEGLNEHNRNLHMVAEVAMESTNIDMGKGYTEEEPLPANRSIELEGLKDSIEEVNAVTNIDANCSSANEDSCADGGADVSKECLELPLPANISNTKQEPGNNQDVRYKKGSLEEEVERIVPAHPDNLYLVWSEKFSLDLALAVARNKSNCILVVNNFSSASLVEVGDLVKTHVTSVIKVGPNPYFLRLFSFGRMTLPGKVLDNGIFKSFTKLESTMRKFTHAQGKKLVNVLKLTQGKDGWYETLRRDLKEDLVITNKV